MIKDKLDKLIGAFKKKEGENNKRVIENMVIFVVILIITIVAINYIWSGDNKNKSINNESNKKLATTDKISQISDDSSNSSQLNNSTNTYNSNSIEERLENILSKIKGVGNVKVLITYSQTSQVLPMYDEDSSSSITEEKDSRRWNKNSKRN